MSLDDAALYRNCLRQHQTHSSARLYYLEQVAGLGRENRECRPRTLRVQLPCSFPLKRATRLRLHSRHARSAIQQAGSSAILPAIPLPVTQLNIVFSTWLSLNPGSIGGNLGFEWLVILKVNIESIRCCWAGIAGSGSGRIQQLNQYWYYVLCSSYPSRRDSGCCQGSSLHLTRPAISPNSGHCRPSPSLGFIPSSKPPIIVAQAKLQLSIVNTPDNGVG